MVSALHNQHEQLLYFSSSKIFYLYQNILKGKANIIANDVGMLFQNTREIQEKLRLVIVVM